MRLATRKGIQARARARGASRRRKGDLTRFQLAIFFVFVENFWFSVVGGEDSLRNNALDFVTLCICTVWKGSAKIE